MVRFYVVRIIYVITFCCGFSINHMAFANVALDELAALEKNKTGSLVEQSNTIASQPVQPADAFFKNHVLVLFFSQTCPYCRAFLPMLKAFSARAGIQVFPYTSNGQGLPDYPHPERMTPEMKRHYFEQGPVVVPASFLVNTQTGSAYPVAFGYLSEPEFAARLQTLVQHIQSYEKTR